MSVSIKDFPSAKDAAAGLLAEHGEAANQESARRFSELRRRFQHQPLFGVAVVSWIAECFPVKSDDGFYHKILSYMTESGEAGAIEEYAQIPLFQEAAALWRVVLITQDASTIADDFSATDIWLYQEIVLNAAGLLGIRKMSGGIGPWLFLGPFKILAAWKAEHWGSMEFANLLYPFGRNEVSAFRFLQAQGADWLGKSIDRILKIEEQNFSTASATITMAQDVQKDLAQTAGSHLLHINAGLRVLGASL